MVVTASPVNPVVSFQDPGTGLSSGNNDPNSAGMFGGPLAMMAVSGLKVDGMNLSVDTSNNTLSVSPGVAMVGHPNSISIQETIGGEYILDWQGDSVLPTVIDSTSGIAVDDSTVKNYVYLRVNPSANNSVDIIVSSTENPSELNNTSIYLGTVNPDSGIVFEDPNPYNDTTKTLPDRWFDSLGINILDAREANVDKLTIGQDEYGIVRDDAELDTALNTDDVKKVIMTGSNTYTLSTSTASLRHLHMGYGSLADGLNITLGGSLDGYFTNIRKSAFGATPVLATSRANKMNFINCRDCELDSENGGTATAYRVGNCTINAQDSVVQVSNCINPVTVNLTNSTLYASDITDLTVDVPSSSTAYLDEVYGLTVNTETGTINGGYLPNNQSYSNISDLATTVSSNTTAGIYDTLLVDASGSAITVTLPNPNAKMRVNVVKIDSSANAVTIATPGSQTINGSSSVSISSQYGSRTIRSDAANYYEI